ncbi:MAG: hypothetical protein DMG85_07565, partial [Acidobacteria bacterium]
SSPLVGPVGHSVIRRPATANLANRRCANPNSAHQDPILFFRLAVLPASYQVTLDAKGRYRIGGQITPRGAPT